MMVSNIGDRSSTEFWNKKPPNNSLTQVCKFMLPDCCLQPLNENQHVIKKKTMDSHTLLSGGDLRWRSPMVLMTFKKKSFSRHCLPKGLCSTCNRQGALLNLQHLLNSQLHFLVAYFLCFRICISQLSGFHMLFCLFK